MRRVEAVAPVDLGTAGTLLAFGLPVPEMAQVAVYSVAGIAPIGWLLAECVLLAHACAPAGDPSRTAGGVFALSTIGNVAGSLLTTFVLLRFLGTAAATIVLAAALCMAAVAAHRRSVPAVALLTVTIFPGLDLWDEAAHYVERNAYADYGMVERTLRSVFADCSSWPVRIEQGRGWHEAVSEPGNLLFRCRQSALDGDTAVYSDAVPRADLDRSLS